MKIGGLKILVANDDGIDSPGIAALADALAELGEVTVVAPHRERSTSSHSLTLHKPLRILPVAERRFATTGTPADCIYLGVREILKEPPDVVVSGINLGANLGTDVHYSGTVAAAREGALLGVPSYAVSLVTYAGEGGPVRFPMAAALAVQIIRETRKLEFPKHTLLNINVPNVEPEAIRGIRIARQGSRFYSSEVTRRLDPRGRPYYWIGGVYQGFERSETSDCHAVNEGYVSVTPISLDGTHDAFLAKLTGLDGVTG